MNYYIVTPKPEVLFYKLDLFYTGPPKVTPSAIRFYEYY